MKSLAPPKRGNFGLNVQSMPGFPPPENSQPFFERLLSTMIFFGGEGTQPTSMIELMGGFSSHPKNGSRMNAGANPRQILNLRGWSLDLPPHPATAANAGLVRDSLLETQ